MATPTQRPALEADLDAALRRLWTAFGATQVSGRTCASTVTLLRFFAPSCTTSVTGTVSPSFSWRFRSKNIT